MLIVAIHAFMRDAGNRSEIPGNCTIVAEIWQKFAEIVVYFEEG